MITSACLDQLSNKNNINYKSQNEIENLKKLIDII